MKTLRAELESSIQADTCRDALKLYGIRYSKLVTPGDTGWPDDLFWIPGGRPLLVEFKKEGEEPRPKQVHVHKILKDLGYDVETHDNRESALASIKRALDAAVISAKRRKISS